MNSRFYGCILSWSLVCGIPGAAGLAAEVTVFQPDKGNVVAFGPVEARFVRLTVYGTSGGNPCIDELEVYAAAGKDNLALASAGAKATASSCLEGFSIHQTAHLNDGKYGNSHSWIAAKEEGEWALIELARPARIERVVFSRDRDGQYADRMPVDVAVHVSSDGTAWRHVASAKSAAQTAAPVSRTAARRTGDVPPSTIPDPESVKSQDGDDAAAIRQAFAYEAFSFYRLERGADPLGRVLGQFDAMIGRFAGKGMDVTAERTQFDDLRQRRQTAAEKGNEPEALQSLLIEARLAKRMLMFRDPALKALTKVLFVKRHPYLPSHNYSDMYDSRFTGGGGVCALDIPWTAGRLNPADARVEMLFDAGKGISRDAVLDWDAGTVYFAHRPPGRPGEAYWNLWRMNAKGGDLKQITEGPFHDYYPCVLPDNGVAFVSTRCRARFLCWVPQSMVLFRMEPDGSNPRALSHANLSEWGPSITRDGRILWTRSEYQDKGADYGHVLWATHPDGTQVELIYGNNSGYNLMNGVEVPESDEICAALVSHFGDFNGPIALIDTSKGRYNPASAAVITPDHMATSNGGRFRDPYPVARDYVLVSHMPGRQWGIYAIDRYGNREQIYMDMAIGSMCPTPFRARPRPPVLASSIAGAAPGAPARLAVADVYQGLGPAVKRGTVKYLRVCEELRSNLERATDGRYVEAYPDFMQYYASPVDRCNGPCGWPTYVAKGVIGTAPVQEDGSAYFEAPAGKSIYFQLLDQDFNEIQRMRSVMQLCDGEIRACVGCHDNRAAAPAVSVGSALRGPVAKLQPPPWGAGPFSYAKVVQPVLDKQCVRCHRAKAKAKPAARGPTHAPGLESEGDDASDPLAGTAGSSSADKNRIDLTGATDNDKVPASYRSLISGGWVNYFNMDWHQRHSKAEPLTFGTVQSKLFKVLAGVKHAGVKLTPDQVESLKCWVDLNVPLWSDYSHRSLRPTQAAKE